MDPRAGSFIFFWLAPATVAGAVPWALTRWRAQPAWFASPAFRIIGILVVVAGVICIIECFARFALKGRGTPAPVAPTEFLVESGLYRHLRNPMYAGVLSVIFGQALVLGSAALLQYALLMGIVFHTFVRLYEEPTLRRQFGPSYDEYRANVPRWRPRLTPWHGSREVSQ